MEKYTPNMKVLSISKKTGVKKYLYRHLFESGTAQKDGWEMLDQTETKKAVEKKIAKIKEETKEEANESDINNDGVVDEKDVEAVKDAIPSKAELMKLSKKELIDMATKLGKEFDDKGTKSVIADAISA